MRSVGLVNTEQGDHLKAEKMDREQRLRRAEILAQDIRARPQSAAPKARSWEVASSSNSRREQAEMINARNEKTKAELIAALLAKSGDPPTLSKPKLPLFIESGEVSAERALDAFTWSGATAGAQGLGTVLEVLAAKRFSCFLEVGSADALCKAGAALPVFAGPDAGQVTWCACAGGENAWSALQLAAGLAPHA